MAHPRKLIRHAVVALLASANTAAGARVSATRVEPHKKTQLPAISVYTLREGVDRGASTESTPRELARETKVEITAWVKHDDAYPVDDAMDDLAEQIEAAMDAAQYLGGIVGDSILEETVMQVLEDAGGNDPLVGVITLTYAVSYLSAVGDGVADDFLRVAAETRVVGADEDNAAHDTFVVQESPSP